jgi:alpha-L-arabinofuranosidase
VLQQLTGDCRGLNGSNVDQALYFQDDIQNSKIENDKSQSFTMTVDGFTDPSIPKGTKVQAKVTITMHADMSLDIQVRSVDNAKAEYVVYMTASPTVVLTSTSSNSSGQIDNEKPQNSIEATLIETKTTSISWSDVRITKDK